MSQTARFGASFADVCIFIAAASGTLMAARLHAFPGPGVAFTLLAGAAVYWLGVPRAVGMTLGKLLWRSHRAIAIPLTAIVFLVSAGLFDHAWVRSPAWLAASAVTFPAFTPQQKNVQAYRWETLPIFYSIGSWPRSFHDGPVYHTVPYEKGPPTRFAGHIIAHWIPGKGIPGKGIPGKGIPGKGIPGKGIPGKGIPGAAGARGGSITLIFEGPKTPASVPSPTEIADCLSHPLRLACFSVRRDVLDRHLTELALLNPIDWRLRWVTIPNPALPEADQTRGFLLEARGASRGQARFVMITPKGTHQAFILDYPQNPNGAEARKVFFQSLGSLRAFDELGSGRAWIDRTLEDVHLEQAMTSGRFSDVQSLLVSKISVDPATFDSYFHLGGTALLLAKEAKKRGLPELEKIASDLLASSSRFAMDVSPSDPRAKKLVEYRQEALSAKP
jgi:hypothetical protein